ncbi:MAG: GIY-YIG nuclease family protein [Ruminococcus sp.]|nr:GIY-YIG nuclease family protein [Ruminococcus sp.]
MYYVYIIRCTGGLLYTGITNDVERRMSEHFGQTEKCAKYTRSHQAEALEALWSAPDRSHASRLEYRIKQLPKAKKLRLIEDDSCLAEFFGTAAADTFSRLSLPGSFHTVPRAKV